MKVRHSVQPHHRPVPPSSPHQPVGADDVSNEPTSDVDSADFEAHRKEGAEDHGGKPRKDGEPQNGEQGGQMEPVAENREQAPARQLQSSPSQATSDAAKKDPNRALAVPETPSSGHRGKRAAVESTAPQRPQHPAPSPFSPLRASATPTPEPPPTATLDNAQLLAALMDSTPDYIYFKDRKSRFLRINRAMARHLNLGHPDEAVGQTDFDFFDKEHAQDALSDEQAVMKTGQPLLSKDEREAHPFGRIRWVSTTKMPLRDTHGQIIGTFGISRDITARKEAEDALHKQAFFDELTGLPNRFMFTDRVNRFIAQNGKSAQDCCVLFVDIDRFKGVSDSLGHRVGNAFLTKVAKRLESCLRPGDMIARLGSDEFAIFLEGLSDERRAQIVATRIQGSLKAPFHIESAELFCSVSIGVALG